MEAVLCVGGNGQRTHIVGEQADLFVSHSGLLAVGPLAAAGPLAAEPLAAEPLAVGLLHASGAPGTMEGGGGGGGLLQSYIQQEPVSAPL